MFKFVRMPTPPPVIIDAVTGAPQSTFSPKFCLTAAASAFTLASHTLVINGQIDQLRHTGPLLALVVASKTLCCFRFNCRRYDQNTNHFLLLLPPFNSFHFLSLFLPFSFSRSISILIWSRQQSDDCSQFRCFRCKARLDMV